MIVSEQINPEKDIYFLGSLLIAEMDKFRNKSIDSNLLFESIQDSHNLSFGLFSLVLDWLFLIGAVDIKKGSLVKCF